jgi:hypothetical protein
MAMPFSPAGANRLGRLAPIHWELHPGFKRIETRNVTNSQSIGCRGRRLRHRLQVNNFRDRRGFRDRPEPKGKCRASWETAALML